MTDAQLNRQKNKTVAELRETRDPERKADLKGRLAVIQHIEMVNCLRAAAETLDEK